MSTLSPYSHCLLLMVEAAITVPDLAQGRVLGTGAVGIEYCKKSARERCYYLSYYTIRY
jgi:hypothetical protein